MSQQKLTDSQLKSIAPELIKWFALNARDLPWRKTKDPYKIWVSEAMLQQTTVNTVISYYERWIKIFPTVRDVADAPLQKILKSWQGLGYYQRARNFHKSAQIISQKYHGRIPSNYEDLRKLPGFGPYTTAAVLSIAFDKPYPIVDANVRRVFMRILAMKGKADTTRDPEIVSFLEKIIPQKKVNIFNQALMEIGALICRVREPACLVCPFRKYCQAFKDGIQQTIPQQVKKNVEEIHAAVGVLEKGKKVFIQQRPKTGLWAEFWEFPGGKIEKNEKPIDALRREMREEIGIEISSARQILKIQHFYTQYKVQLYVFLCQTNAAIALKKGRKWASLDQLEHFPMPSANTKILAQLRKIFIDKY
jgi:A/G-specific adenine glycosylase